jgi:hypothetical protein
MSLRALLVAAGWLPFALSACGILVSFDYDLGPQAAPSYAVGGTVEGLAGDEAVALTLNGGPPITAHAGAFTFAEKLASGVNYAVAVASTPKGHTCTVGTRGQGVIAGADVRDVVVHCPATDATLASLEIPGTTLIPTENPVRLTARVKTSATFWTEAPLTVKAVATDPAAQIRIAGGAPSIGTASGPFTAKQGMSSIAINVTAPDGIAHATYTIEVTAYPSDYIKASNTRTDAQFGHDVAVSGDGRTLVVGSWRESSGVAGDQNNESAGGAGAAYVFVRDPAGWTQEAYLKASAPAPNSELGTSVAISSDGNVVAIGARIEGGGATNAGAVHVFTRTGSAWTEQAVVRAPQQKSSAEFGSAVAMSANGTTLVVGAPQEDTATGAVYVFTRPSGGSFAWQKTLLASNPVTNASFGASVALSTDGKTLAVGAYGEDGTTTGVTTNYVPGAANAGAAYVFERGTSDWSQTAYVKATNTRSYALFGFAVALSGDGVTLAVGSPQEASKSVADPINQDAGSAGAVYVYVHGAGGWAPQSYLKTPYPRKAAEFGRSVSLSTDGNTLAAGAYHETSLATGVNGDQTSDQNPNGAAYVFTRTTAQWTERAYLKPSFTLHEDHGPQFGASVSLSHDGQTLGVGADYEWSNAKGINGDATNALAEGAGAAYVF